MDFAALVAGMQHDSANKRPEIARSIESCFRIAERFGQLRNPALVDFGNAGMDIGNILRRLCQPRGDVRLLALKLGHARFHGRLV